MKKTLFLILILLTYQAAASAQESIILSAMKNELTRSMEQLELDDKEGPYYISYLIKDVYNLRITSDSGAITANSDNHYRMLNTDLRVGDYTLDNSNFMSLNLSNITSLITSSNERVTVDDDYNVLRRQIWLATDKAYKAALDNIAKKKASLQNTVQTDTLPDFTKGTATSGSISKASFTVQKDRWTQFVEQLSQLFLNQRHIQKSKVDLKVQIVNSYYVNSEGARHIGPASTTQLLIAASTQADDGMPVGNYLLYTASHPKELPDKSSLDRDIHTMIEELLASREAPISEDYSGPVLFLGQAAGELFGQGLSNFLLGREAPLTDNPQLSAMTGRMFENPFLGKVDRRVTAKFISITASPSLKDFSGKTLLGSYHIDDEGVQSRDVQVVDNGILKNLLTTRTPVKGFDQSNGHCRGGSSAPSVIRITSTKKYTMDELKQELIKAVEEEGLPFGYIVKGLTPPSVAAELEGSDVMSLLLMQQQGSPPPNQFQLTKPYLVFRVYPDGREELVRGIEFRSLSVNAFKDIIATSDKAFVYDYPVSAPNVSSGLLSSILNLLGASGLLGQEYYATVITPSMLIGDIELKQIAGNYRKPPIVNYPLK